MKVWVQIDCSGWNHTAVDREVFRVYQEFGSRMDAPSSYWNVNYPLHTYCVDDARIDWATEELAKAGIVLTVLGRA